MSSSPSSSRRRIARELPPWFESGPPGVATAPPGRASVPATARGMRSTWATWRMYASKLRSRRRRNSAPRLDQAEQPARDDADDADLLLDEVDQIAGDQRRAAADVLHVPSCHGSSGGDSNSSHGAVAEGPERTGNRRQLRAGVESLWLPCPCGRQAAIGCRGCESARAEHRARARK